MQRCNGFLISGIALTAGAPLCISWFGLVGFYFGVVTGSGGSHFMDSLFLYDLLIAYPPSQPTLCRKIYIDCRYLLFSVEHCADMDILCQFSQSA